MKGDEKMKNDWEKVEDSDIFKFEKEGDVIEGQFLQISESSLYKDSYVVEIATEKDGVKACFVSNIVADKIVKASISSGDEIKILFSGKQKNKAGTFTYKLFDVFVKKKSDTK